MARSVPWLFLVVAYCSASISKKQALNPNITRKRKHHQNVHIAKLGQTLPRLLCFNAGTIIGHFRIHLLSRVPNILVKKQHLQDNALEVSTVPAG